MLGGRSIKAKPKELEEYLKELLVVNLHQKNIKNHSLLVLQNLKKDVKNMKEQGWVLFQTRLTVVLHRVIYQYAIDQSTINGDIKEIEELKTEFINFEKRHGTREGIEDVILNNRRAHYEKLLKEDNYAYDTWFDLIRLEESEVISYRTSLSPFSIISKAISRCRDVYRRAVENIPPVQEKRYWRRYIYLWISFAIFEELHGGDVPSFPDEDDEDDQVQKPSKTKVINGIKRARDVYKECLKVIPHKIFTFGKIWLEAAYLEVRDKDLAAARKLLGTAIGLNFPYFLCHLY